MITITIKRSGEKWIAERSDNGNIVGYTDDPQRLYDDLDLLRKEYDFKLELED